MQPGSPEYRTEVDQIREEEWHELIQDFDDAVIYQTWSYGAVRWGAGNLSHFILRRGDEVVAAAQATILRLPVLGVGVCYAPWGPLWRRRGREGDPAIFAKAVEAIREEYSRKRGLVVRVTPSVTGEHADRARDALGDAGYRSRRPGGEYRTILVDLTPSLEDLRRGLSKEWRENLRRAGRSELEVEMSTSAESFRVFKDLYREMHARKKFTEFVSVHEFMALQKKLPENLKMKLILCRRDGEIVAGLVWSAIGERGIPIFSATANKGLKLRGSYLLRWQMLETLKERGCLFLDQGGVDPDRNPGGHHFKAGMGGEETSHIGAYEVCDRALCRAVVRAGDAVRNSGRRMKMFANVLSHPSQIFERRGKS